jgi:Family of unknown function (DUF6152)
VKRTFIVLAFALLVFEPSASGHHSFAAYYFENESVSIEGEVVEFEYRNPHAWVHVSVPDAAGEMRKYGAEWSNPNRLGQQGITKDTIKPGDRVIVTGSPGRTATEYKIHLKRIVRPADGWKWGGGRERR